MLCSRALPMPVALSDNWKPCVIEATMHDVSTPYRVLPVATVLTPIERLRVDAAGEGSYEALHRDSMDEVVQDIKQNRVSAVLVSITRCDQRARLGVAAMVREFPRIPTVALLTQLDSTTPQAMLSLGSTGVRQ